MIVYLSGPTGPVTHPLPDTDSDQYWRTEARDRLKSAGHQVIDISNLGWSKALVDSDQIRTIIHGMVLGSDMVIAHAISGSWQSQYELEIAVLHKIPIYVNVVGTIDRVLFRVMWQYPSMSAAIDDALIALSGMSADLANLAFADLEDELEITFNEASANTLKIHPVEISQIPKVQYPGEDCGYDLVVLSDSSIQADQFLDVDCGISLELPPDYWGFITGRSSTFRQKGLLVLPGVIDNGYRGPIFVGIFNTNKQVVEIKKGERLAQLILLPLTTFPVEIVEELSESRRGDKGFGSTGA